MKHTLKTMRGRIEELGITEAVTQKQGKNRIRIELPGVHDPEAAKKNYWRNRIIRLLPIGSSILRAAGIIQMS